MRLTISQETGRIAAARLPGANFQSSRLAALVGRDARLHLVGLNREILCQECGEPPFIGWVVAAVPDQP